MSISESIIMALSAIWVNKLRSALTLLGVIIGVATIIAMMTIIAGLQDKIEEDMSILAPNVFQVQRYDNNISFNSGPRQFKYRRIIERKHADAIREFCPSAMLVGPEAWKYQREVNYRDKKTNPNTRLAGGTPEFQINNGYYVGEGRFITNADDDFTKPVIVLAFGTKEKLFEHESPIGKQVKIDGNRFTVVGVLEEQGSMFDDQMNFDSVIPLSTFEKIYGDKRSINITIQAKNSAVFQKAQDEAVNVMRSIRGLKPGEDNDFGMFSSASNIETFNQMTLWIKIAAIGICGISLLVAGIGIMNIMLVSVTERTREIGIRKAVGGKKRSIRFQFLVEAIILSEIGGIIGVGVGFGGGKLFGSVADMPTAIPIWSVVLGLVFCSVVGIVFGSWPAFKAARLEPIEALRYE